MKTYNRRSWNVAGREETLAVFVVYDPGGIVDNSVIFYMMSLKKMAGRMVVAVNGILTETGEIKIRAVTDEIYCRPNTGFDFGAYKDVIENYLMPGELAQYQELILCNDTCYGPFLPFEYIFSQMRGRDLQFWSMNYMEDPLLPHFQSYFMDFRGEAINLLEDFLHREVDDDVEDPIQACGYEHGLSEVILSSGMRTGYYTSMRQGYHNLDIFKAPDYALEKLGLPLMKKRAFSDELAAEDNCRRALQMIAEQGVYPTTYIWENVFRKYHKDFSDALQGHYVTEAHFFEKNYITRQEIISFCKSHQKIYLYGNGYMAVLFMARFQRYMNAFGGYVVSDDHYTEKKNEKDPIYRLSQIGKEAPLIVAMTSKVAVQVADSVRDRKNVLFLSLDSKTIDEHK